MTYAFRAEGLTKRFGTTQALAGIGLTGQYGQGGELVDVHGGTVEGQAVATHDLLDQRGIAQRPAQPGNQGLQCACDVARELFAPDRVDELLG